MAIEEMIEVLREAAKDGTKRYSGYHLTSADCTAVADHLELLLQIIENYVKTKRQKQQETAQRHDDAEPVRHGRWNKVRKVNVWGNFTDVLECSICCKHDVHGKGITRESDYCPNCGARMDGGNENGKI